jgi:hypothetical protein
VPAAQQVNGSTGDMCDSDDRAPCGAGRWAGRAGGSKELAWEAGAVLCGACVCVVRRARGGAAHATALSSAEPRARGAYSMICGRADAASGPLNGGPGGGGFGGLVSSPASCEAAWNGFLLNGQRPISLSCTFVDRTPAPAADPPDCVGGVLRWRPRFPLTGSGCKFLYRETKRKASPRRLGP